MRGAATGGGVIDQLMDKLRALGRGLAGRFLTAGAVDTQSVKMTESAGIAGYDAGKKVNGRKRHLVVDFEGLPIKTAAYEASVQDWDGALAVILGMLEKTSHVWKLWADCGYQGLKLASALKGLGLGHGVEIASKPKDVKGSAVLYRRWVVERTLVWILRCRRLPKDYEWSSLESSLAWAQLAQCRFIMHRIGRAIRC